MVIFEFRTFWLKFVFIFSVNSYYLSNLRQRSYFRQFSLEKFIIPSHFISRPIQPLDSLQCVSLDLEKIYNNGITPLLVFINSASGGRNGNITRKLANILSPLQICDIKSQRPKDLLQLFQNFDSKMRILSCGGDGTLSWIIDEARETKLKCNDQIHFGLLPFGTGNDLFNHLVGINSSTLGQLKLKTLFSPTSFLKHPESTLALCSSDIRNELPTSSIATVRSSNINKSDFVCQSILLDRWKISFKNLLQDESKVVNENPSDNTMLPNEESSKDRVNQFVGQELLLKQSQHINPPLPLPLPPSRRLKFLNSLFFTSSYDEKKKRQWKKSKTPPPSFYFHNYLGLGLDAAVTQSFSSMRSRFPFLFAHPLLNKMWYALISSYLFFLGPPFPFLDSMVDLIVDGERVEFGGENETRENQEVGRKQSRGGKGSGEAIEKQIQQLIQPTIQTCKEEGGLPHHETINFITLMKNKLNKYTQDMKKMTTNLIIKQPLLRFIHQSFFPQKTSLPTLSRHPFSSTISFLHSLLKSLLKVLISPFPFFIDEFWWLDWGKRLGKNWGGFQGLAFINIASYAGGSKVWPNCGLTEGGSKVWEPSEIENNKEVENVSDSDDSEDSEIVLEKIHKGHDLMGYNNNKRILKKQTVVPQSCQDGIIEVVGILNLVHFGLLKLGLCYGVPIAQGREITVKFKSPPPSSTLGSSFYLPMQMDGEAWESKIQLRKAGEDDIQLSEQEGGVGINEIEIKLGERSKKLITFSFISPHST